jgi:hypothetical protein
MEADKPMTYRINAIAGIAGLIAFALTGAYMHIAYHHLHGMADGSRIMFRSAHIYLLWAALLNLLLGANFTAILDSQFARIQRIAALMIALVPLLLLCSFFTESANPDFYRPLARAAIYLAATGVLIQVCASYCQSVASRRRTTATLAGRNTSH